MTPASDANPSEYGVCTPQSAVQKLIDSTARPAAGRLFILHTRKALHRDAAQEGSNGQVLEEIDAAIATTKNELMHYLSGHDELEHLSAKDRVTASHAQRGCSQVSLLPDVAKEYVETLSDTQAASAASYAGKLSDKAKEIVLNDPIPPAWTRTEAHSASLG